MRKNEIVTVAEFFDNGSLRAFSQNMDARQLEIAPPEYAATPSVWLKKWWDGRAVPLTRAQIAQFLSERGCSVPQEYLIKNLGLSLTDYYWIKDVQSDLTWEEVNLFDNAFHEDIPLSEKEPEDDGIPRYSPNSSLQGNIEKTWTIVDGKRCLVKGNHGSASNESINEVIACRIHELQGYDNYTRYDLLHIKGKPYAFGCISEAFTSQERELVSAWAVCSCKRKPDGRSLYEHFIETAASFGIDADELRADLEYQILTDFIMSGYDRHLTNIAVLRDAESLKYIRMAPIFDSGGSFFAEREFPRNEKELAKMEITSFAKTENRLLKLVKDPNRIDLTKLPPASYIRSEYEKDERISEKTIDAIVTWYEKKIDACRLFQFGRDMGKKQI